MLLNDEVDRLRRVPLFAKMEMAKLKLLAFTSDRMSFQPQQVLFHQGDDGDAAYVIMKGEADIVAETAGGDIPLARVGENAIVGEIAILCEVPRTATVKAATQMDTLRIEKEHFLRLIREFPELGIEVMRELADRLTRTTAELSQARSAISKAKR